MQQMLATFAVKGVPSTYHSYSFWRELFSKQLA
jgi:hypothetical protein